MPAASPSPSSSSSSSATPPPQISISKKKKSNGKQKSVPEDHGKNEGEDLNWAYAPPPDAVLINEEEIDAGNFDWDTIKNDDDLELWLIRIPDSIKPKVLENQKVDIPEGSKSACIGTMNRKHASFDIWSVGDDNNPLISGEEIKSLSCLLPRKSKKGQLYPAPKPIARHLIIVAQPVKPTSDPSATAETAHKNPPRFSYPREVLKHAFVPYGSLTNHPAATVDDEVEPMEVDELPPPPSPKKKRSKTTAPEDDMEVKSTKGKKRKGEVGAPEAPSKKSKKIKVA